MAMFRFLYDPVPVLVWIDTEVLIVHPEHIELRKLLKMDVTLDLPGLSVLVLDTKSHRRRGRA
jgi:hypothetical protein